jgi:lipoprotein-anchoring transpeptidase ErfK/SrfK
VRAGHALRRLSCRIVVMAAVAITAASCSSGSSSPPTAQKTPAQHGMSLGSLTNADSSGDAPVAPAGSTLLATLHGAVQGYATPGGAKGPIIPATWHGAVSTLPVVTAQPGWLDVRLAQRPNESTAWVPVADVTLTSSPYKILIDLKAMHLYLFKADKLIYAAPAGIGTVADPTPTGEFFVAFFATPPNSGYGPFVMVSSAHSNTISDWESSGDALMAIHGPLGADAQIGTTGARVSHGCVRLHVADLVHLRVVPAGSPIDVVAS